MRPGEVHLWLWPSDHEWPLSLLRRLQRHLAREERERAQRFRREAPRRVYVEGRALLRDILSRYADRRPEEWRFAVNPQGKPRLSNPPPRGADLRFNLSHAPGLNALGVARDLEIGVDVESHERRVDGEAIARRFFAAEERAMLAALPPGARRRVFFDLWALKESYLKARGLGLSTPLRNVVFDLGGAEPQMLRPAGGVSWSFRLLRPTGHHVVAVAAGRTVEVTTRWWVPDELAAAAC